MKIACLLIAAGLFAGCAQLDMEYAMGPATCHSKQVGGFLATQLNTLCWQNDKVVGFGSTAGTSPAEILGAGVIAGGAVGASAVIANQAARGAKLAVKVGP